MVWTGRFTLIGAMVPLGGKAASSHTGKLTATVDASSSGPEQFKQAVSRIVWALIHDARPVLCLVWRYFTAGTPLDRRDHPQELTSPSLHSLTLRTIGRVDPACATCPQSQRNKPLLTGCANRRQNPCLVSRDDSIELGTDDPTGRPRQSQSPTQPRLHLTLTHDMPYPPDVLVAAGP